MPGHYTFLMRIWNYPNLTVIAGAFNHRDAGAIDGTINQRIIDAYYATSVWPALDLSSRQTKIGIGDRFSRRPTCKRSTL